MGTLLRLISCKRFAAAVIPSASLKSLYGKIYKMRCLRRKMLAPHGRDPIEKDFSTGTGMGMAEELI